MKSKRGSYGDKKRRQGADRYGQVRDGQIQDVVAGTILTYKVGVQK